MKRLFRAALVAAILPIGLASVGCAHKSGSACGAGDCGAGGGGGHGGGGHGSGQGAHGKFYDISWPDRYNYAARQAVVAPFAQQAANGHFLHQSLWNFYFEPGNEKLTAGGMDKLDSLARSTPSGPAGLYPDGSRPRGHGRQPDKVAGLRSDLNAKRAASIKRYMTTQFGTAIDYEVYVHDAPVPSIYGVFAGSSFRGQAQGYVGGLGGGGGGAAPAVGGGGTRGSMSGPPPGTGGNTTVNVTPASTPGSPAP